MKLNKLILPVTMLFALTGCSGAEPVAEGGGVPSGGKEVTDKEEAEKDLEELVEKASGSLNENDAFGFTLTNKGTTVTAHADLFDFNASVGECTLTGGAEGLVTGTKATTKAGLNFSGTKLTYKVDATPAEAEEVHIDKNYDIGAINTYFDNGSIYVDASETGLAGLIKGVLTDATPTIEMFAEQYLGPEMAGTVATMLTTLTSSEAAVTAFIGGTFFNKALGFNYKMSFENIVSEEDYPLVKIDAQVEDASATVAEIKAGFEETTGLAWDDVMSVYTYASGGKAIQFELDKDAIISMIYPEQVVSYGLAFDDASVKIGVYFNEKGVPTSASFKEVISGSASGDMFVNAMGSALTFNSSSEINLTLSAGSNPVTFPENYNDYNAFSMSGISSLLA